MLPGLLDRLFQPGTLSRFGNRAVIIGKNSVKLPAQSQGSPVKQFRCRRSPQG